MTENRAWDLVRSKYLSIIVIKVSAVAILLTIDTQISQNVSPHCEQWCLVLDTGQ